MAGPLEGTKVVELGLWVAAPSAAAMLADWGADVVKIEPPNGDPFRGWASSLMGAAVDMNPPFELDNRGKRSVVLQLENEDARSIAYQLLEDADVFVTICAHGLCRSSALTMRRFTGDSLVWSTAR